MTSLAEANAALLRAAKSGDLAGVAAALAAGAAIDHRIEQGWTAAMWAARGHHVEVFSYLADKGADLSIRDGLNHDFWDISASNYQENYSRSSKIQAMARRGGIDK
jgi:ankyrin repeat protein